ncbi:hypothetical protein AX17_006881 [Amanita inopinata Kibby_2008]|nr:hypothetical protein AX17_006881 [Amanita inopinata Kibby_2008]
MYFATIFTFAFLLISGVTAIDDPKYPRLPGIGVTVINHPKYSRLALHPGTCQGGSIRASETPITAKECKKKEGAMKRPAVGFMPANGSGPEVQGRCLMPYTAYMFDKGMLGTCYYKAEVETYKYEPPYRHGVWGGGGGRRRF